MVVLVAVYGAVVAAMLASFGCVVAERGLRGESLMGRSHCACGRQLRLTENVPVVGWLRARGVTPCCGARIPRHYVTSEAAMGLFGAGVGAWVGSVIDDGGPVVVAAGGAAALAVATSVLVFVLRRRAR